MKKLITLFVLFLLFTGCATIPKEAPITVKLSAPITNVQFRLEDIVREKAPHSQITNQTANILTISNDCMDLKEMDALKCSMVMMGIGNSGWSGPFHIQNYRFAEIDGQTNVRGDWSWCAVNAFGKQNCSAINPAGPNSILRELEKVQWNETGR